MSLPATRTRTLDSARDAQDVYERLGQLIVSAFDDGNDLLRSWAPLADIVETPDAYLIDVDLPGVKRDDVDIEIDGNQLIITGELKAKEREGLFRRRTRRVGRFEYRTTLPRDASLDEKTIEAKLVEGVLTVKIPKSESAKPRRIAIGTK